MSDKYHLFRDVPVGGHANAYELISVIESLDCRIRAKVARLLKESLHNFIYFERGVSFVLIRVSAFNMKKKFVTHSQLVNRAKKFGFKEAPREACFYFHIAHDGLPCDEVKVISELIPFEHQNHILLLSGIKKTPRRQKYSIELLEVTSKTCYFASDWVLFQS